MMTRSSSGRINIAAIAQKLDVDNRISLRFYYRVADNILKQADIFRLEGNIIDLYVMLLRFSSLVSETIPCHRDYRMSPQSNKTYLRKRLQNALSELEELKPAVQRKIEELNRKRSYQENEVSHHHKKNSLGFPLDQHHLKTQNPSSYGIYAAKNIQTVQNGPRELICQGANTQHYLLAKPVNERFRQLTLNLPRPKVETLTRHSILGPSGLSGQWQAPSNNIGVRYPSITDLSPIEIPRLQKPVDNGDWIIKDDLIAEPEGQNAELTVLLNTDNQVSSKEEPASLISFEQIESPLETEIIRQPSPPPILADVQDLIQTTSAPVTDTQNGLVNSSADALVASEDPLQLHISTALMDSFMKLAKSNTDKNLETCGVLAGSLKNRKFYVTALIIPKQESTSDSCQTTNEEEIFEVQDKQSLFPLGWIHTHPTQSCFMSSIDLHTHYSYQIMLPEAIAIVMAPRDSSRKHGIFRLTTPGGMTVIRQCPRRGFHPHDPTPDGSPIYKQCTDVYMSSNLKFDVIDLR